MDGQPWARQAAQRSKSLHTRHLKRRPCTRPPQRSPWWKIRQCYNFKDVCQFVLFFSSKTRNYDMKCQNIHLLYTFVQRNFFITKMKSMQGEQYINIPFLLASSRDLILLIHDAVAFSQTFVSTSCGDQSVRFKF